MLKDTITQPVVSSSLLVLYLLTARFFVENWGYSGLVWAGVARSGLGILIFWFILSLRFPRDNMKQTLASILIYGLAAFGAYASGRFVVFEMERLPALLQLLAGGAVSISVYAAVLHFMDRKMLHSILEVFGMYSVLNKLQIFNIPLVQSWSIKSERDR